MILIDNGGQQHESKAGRVGAVTRFDFLAHSRGLFRCHCLHGSIYDTNQYRNMSFAT